MPPKRKTDGDRCVPPSNSKKAKLYDEKELVFINTSVVETPWVSDRFSGHVWTPPEAPYPSPLAPPTTSKVSRAIYNSNLSRSSQTAVGALYSRFKQAGNVHRARLEYRKGFGNDERVLVTQLERDESKNSTQSGLPSADFYLSGDVFELNDADTTITTGESAIIECHKQGTQSLWFLRFIQPLRHLRINHVLYNFNGTSGIIGPLPEFTIVQSLSQAKFIFTSYAGLRCAPPPALFPPNIFESPEHSDSLTALSTESMPDKSTRVESIQSTTHDNLSSRDKASRRADSSNIVLETNNKLAAPKIDTSLPDDNAPSSFAPVLLGKNTSHEGRPRPSEKTCPSLFQKQRADRNEEYAKTKQGMQAPAETMANTTQLDVTQTANSSSEEASLQIVFPKEVCEIITAAATEAIKAKSKEKEKKALKERRERMDRALKAQKDFEDDMAKLKAEAEAAAAHAIMLRENQLRAAEERIKKQKDSKRAEQGDTSMASAPVSAPAVDKKRLALPPANASKDLSPTMPNKPSIAGQDAQLDVGNVYEQANQSTSKKKFATAKSRGSIANARLDYFGNKTRPEDAAAATSEPVPTASAQQANFSNKKQATIGQPSADPSPIPIVKVSSAPDLPSLSSSMSPSMSQKGSSSPKHSSSSVTLHGTKDRETCRAHPKTAPSTSISASHHPRESLFTSFVDSASASDSNISYPNAPLNPPGFRLFADSAVSHHDSFGDRDNHTQTRLQTQSLFPTTPASPAAPAAPADNDGSSASSTRANASTATSTNGDGHERKEDYTPASSSPAATLPIPGLGLLAPPPSTPSVRPSCPSSRAPSSASSEHGENSDDLRSLFEE